MATEEVVLAVFAWLPAAPYGKFVPAGLLTLTEAIGANPQNRELTSRFSYDTGYLKRPQAIDVDPVSLNLKEADSVLSNLRKAAYYYLKLALPLSSCFTGASTWTSANRASLRPLTTLSAPSQPSRPRAPTQSASSGACGGKSGNGRPVSQSTARMNSL